MVVAAEMMMQKGNLTPHIMIQNLKRGQLRSFIALFSTYTGLPIETVSKIMRQSNGQGLAIACRALDVVKSDFINMYLLTARLRSNLIINQEDLNKALSYFESIDVEQAINILNKSRH